MRHLVYCGVSALIFLCLAFTCSEEVDLKENEVVFFCNASDERIFVYYLPDGELLTPKIALRNGVDYLRKIEPGEIVTYYRHIPSEYFPAFEKTQFIIFKNSTIENYSVSELSEMEFSDAYFAYDYYELKNMNFKIYYNGEN